jgi:SAM-dependent methyltransferase
VKGKCVLHVGCSDFPITEERIRSRNLLHIKLQDSAKEVIGIDLSEEGIGILKTFGIDNVFVMDAEDIKLTTSFDTILGGDVLEHMNNPGKFLEKASRLLNPNGEIILGVPSALTINNLKCWLGRWEQVHSDHTFYFSPKTLSTLCSRYGLLPTKLIFTVQPQGAYESTLFVVFRKILLKLFKTMAPSFIMHFKRAEEIDQYSFIEWK